MAAATEVVRALRGDGLNAWMDVDGVVASDGLARSILGALDGAMAVVLLLTTRAVFRPWVQAELERARSMGIAVLALRLSNTPVPPWLSGVNVVELDVSSPDGLTELSDRLRRIARRSRE